MATCIMPGALSYENQAAATAALNGMHPKRRRGRQARSGPRDSAQGVLIAKECPVPGHGYHHVRASARRR